MVGERLRQAVHNLQVVFQGQALQMSISLGCATLQAGESADGLQQRADQALYQAKRNGRNRLNLASWSAIAQLQQTALPIKSKEAGDSPSTNPLDHITQRLLDLLLSRPHASLTRQRGNKHHHPVLGSLL